VTVVTRHGARSAIHEPTTVERARFECDISFDLQERLGPDFPRPRTDEKKRCLEGQLLERGFRQHLRLGEELRRAYDLDDRWTLEEVRSTDYQRTRGSALALLAGAFPGLAEQRDLARRVHVWGDDDQTHFHGEPMYGAGSHAGKGLRCEPAQRDVQRQKDSFVARLRLDPAYSVFDGNQTSLNKTITEVADALYSRLCETASPSLCLSGGFKKKRKCLTDDEASALLAEADRYYCARYVGDDGGSHANTISTYPFVHELLAGLATATDAATPAFRLYSGHDTVVAPLAAALGFFDCRWPALASHVVFELYQSHANGGDRLLRVLYNGRPVAVPLCADDNMPRAALPREEAGLCRFDDFAAAFDERVSAAYAGLAGCDDITSLFPKTTAAR